MRFAYDFATLKSTADPWSPDQYAKFREERSLPFFDLLDLVEPEPEMRVVDLGCGTGDLTRILHERLRAVETLGVDRSEAMLARCKDHAVEGMTFGQGDIAAFHPSAPCDLIFSNAALQWVPDHKALLQRLASFLTDRGQIAAQVPANSHHPTHVIAKEIAQEEPFAAFLQGFRGRRPVPDPEEYARILHSIGFKRQHVRLQVYAHELPSRESVLEWVNGTLLTPFQQRLSDKQYEEFFAEYERRLLPLLDKTKPYFYPFPRILFWGRL